MKIRWLALAPSTLASLIVPLRSTAGSTSQVSGPLLRLRADVNAVRSDVSRLRLEFEKDVPQYGVPAFVDHIAEQVHALVVPLEREQAAILDPSIVARATAAATNAALAITPLVYVSGLAYVGAQSASGWQEWLSGFNSAVNTDNVRLAVLATDLGFTILSP